MADKIYAVKKGKTTGIFYSWEECKTSVSGYKGAQFKSFMSEKEAIDYLGDDDCSIYKNTVINAYTNLDHAVAFVDGSFNESDCLYGGGCVLFSPDNKTVTIQFCGNNQDYALSRNVAGEIYSAIAAVKHCIKNNIQNLVIYHDYEGICKWATGDWTANKELTINYKNYMQSIKDSVSVDFVKVKGHSNNRYNDYADKLAKEAANGDFPLNKFITKEV